ncbi:MAG: ABC transporter permease [Thermomicrobiales bacterium]|nr:ABC transporter permease [Thermomicrobiales bacterium]
MSSQAPPTEAGAATAWQRLLAGIPTLLSSLLAVGIALAAGGVVIALSGDNPIPAYQALFEGAFGSQRAIAETLVMATPLILGGLAFAVAARAGLFNIGIEGQMVMGGLAAGLTAAVDLGLPAYIHLPLALLAGTLAGGVWGFIPGLLKANTGAHEVITTIMLNYLAYRISTVVIGREDLPLVNPALQATQPALEPAELPRLLPGTRLHAGFIIAIVAAIVVWYVLYRTVFGYKLRTVGLSAGAAAYAGFSWGRTIALAMLISGLLAGLGGTVDTLGLQGRFYNVAIGLGFTSIAVGLVGRNQPFGVVLSGLLFGALAAGATKMQNTAGISRDIVYVLLGFVIFSISALAVVQQFRAARRQAARARSMTRDRAADDAGEPLVEPPVPPRTI